MARKRPIGKGGKTIDGLNQLQEAFCKAYTIGDKEFFGNGVKSYIAVYQPDQTQKNWYRTACSVASEILTNPNIIKRINELLDTEGFNDVNIDKQLLFLINQFDDKNTKLAALKEYNRLKARVIEKQSDINITLDLSTKSMKELDELRKQHLSK